MKRFQYFYLVNSLAIVLLIGCRGDVSRFVPWETSGNDNGELKASPPKEPIQNKDTDKKDSEGFIGLPGYSLLCEMIEELNDTSTQASVGCWVADQEKTAVPIDQFSLEPQWNYEIIMTNILVEVKRPYKLNGIDLTLKPKDLAQPPTKTTLTEAVRSLIVFVEYQVGEAAPVSKTISGTTILSEPEIIPGMLNTPPPCPGVVFNGSCWLEGSPGQTCVTACSEASMGLNIAAFMALFPTLGSPVSGNTCTDFWNASGLATVILEIPPDLSTSLEHFCGRNGDLSRTFVGNVPYTGTRSVPNYIPLCACE